LRLSGGWPERLSVERIRLAKIAGQVLYLVDYQYLGSMRRKHSKAGSPGLGQPQDRDAGVVQNEPRRRGGRNSDCCRYQEASEGAVGEQHHPCPWPKILAGAHQNPVCPCGHGFVTGISVFPAVVAHGRIERKLVVPAGQLAPAPPCQTAAGLSFPQLGMDVDRKTKGLGGGNGGVQRPNKRRGPDVTGLAEARLPESHGKGNGLAVSDFGEFGVMVAQKARVHLRLALGVANENQVHYWDHGTGRAEAGATAEWS